jgi:hypothetical protein
MKRLSPDGLFLFVIFYKTIAGNELKPLPLFACRLNEMQIAFLLFFLIN